MNHWTKDEIRLTRYAWYLHDVDKIDRNSRSLRPNIFVCVGLLIATTTLWVLT